MKYIHVIQFSVFHEMLSLFYNRNKVYSFHFSNSQVWCTALQYSHLLTVAVWLWTWWNQGMYPFRENSSYFFFLVLKNKLFDTKFYIELELKTPYLKVRNKKFPFMWYIYKIVYTHVIRIQVKCFNKWNVVMFDT